MPRRTRDAGCSTAPIGRRQRIAIACDGPLFAPSGVAEYEMAALARQVPCVLVLLSILGGLAANSDKQHENQRGRAVVRVVPRDTLGRAILSASLLISWEYRGEPRGKR